MALLADSPAGLELWVAEAATGRARKVMAPRVNAAFGSGYEWLPDSSGLLVRTVPTGRGAAPVVSGAPGGPTIQESAGRSAPVRTYQDLLRNAGDERLFDHYFTSQLLLVALTAPRPSGWAPLA
jgi:hypothetical protein